jgi:Ni,Fe-hydrogenase I cytochrome b subunit
MASGQGHGSMSFSMKFIRLLIVLFNLAFIIIGVILFAIGIYVVKDPKMQQLRALIHPELTFKYSQGLETIEIFALVLIIISSILSSIGFLGKN